MDKRAVPPSGRKQIIEFDLDGAPRGAVSRLCEELGITRAAFYKIRKQAATRPADPGAALMPRKSGPAEHRSVVGPDMESLLVGKRAWLSERGWDCGPASVRSRLIREGVVGVPSRATIARLFARLGLSNRQPSKRPRSSYRRFRWPRANDMWQLDGTEVRLDDQRRTRQVVYQVEDDHSRMIVSWAIDRTENSRTAIKVVSDAVDLFGAPVRFLTDNGVSFNMSRRGLTAPLEAWLRLRGVEPVTGKPGKPTTQGKNERLHRTLKQFLDAHRPIHTPGELAALVEQFTCEYNTDRPHQELGGQTPTEAYQQAAKAPAPLPPAGAVPPGREPSPGPSGAVRSAPPRHDKTTKARKPQRPTDTATEATTVVTPYAHAYALGCRIYIGVAYRGQTVHLTQTDGRIDVYDNNGEHLGWALRPPRKPGTHVPTTGLQPPLPLH